MKRPILHRRRLAFDERAVASDGYGGTSGEWIERLVCHAGMVPLRGGEQVLAQRLTGVQPVVFRVRQSSKTRAITTDWRARDAGAGTIYSIASIIDPNAGNAKAGMDFDLLCQTGEAP